MKSDRTGRAALFRLLKQRQERDIERRVDVLEYSFGIDAEDLRAHPFAHARSDAARAVDFHSQLRSSWIGVKRGPRLPIGASWI